MLFIESGFDLPVNILPFPSFGSYEHDRARRPGDEVVTNPLNYIFDIIAINPSLKRVVVDRFVSVVKRPRECIVVCLVPGMMIADEDPVSDGRENASAARENAVAHG